MSDKIDLIFDPNLILNDTIGLKACNEGFTYYHYCDHFIASPIHDFLFTLLTHHG